MYSTVYKKDFFFSFFFFEINLLLEEGLKVVGSVLFATCLGREPQMEKYFPGWFPGLSYLRQ